MFRVHKIWLWLLTICLPLEMKWIGVLSLQLLFSLFTCVSPCCHTEQWTIANYNIQLKIEWNPVSAKNVYYKLENTRTLDFALKMCWMNWTKWISHEMKCVYNVRVCKSACFIFSAELQFVRSNKQCTRVCTTLLKWFISSDKWFWHCVQRNAGWWILLLHLLI